MLHSINFLLYVQTLLIYKKIRELLFSLILLLVNTAPGVVVDNVATANKPNSCKLIASPAARVVIIVALNDVSC